jgi:hypothetical protein
MIEDIAGYSDLWWSEGLLISHYIVTTYDLSHQQNANWSKRNMQSSRTLRATSEVLLHTSTCSFTPPGAKQSALGLCKSIHRCSWKHLALWRCIQNAMRCHLYSTRILELLKPRGRSAGDFDRNWDCNAPLRDSLGAPKPCAQLLSKNWCCFLTAVVLT